MTAVIERGETEARQTKPVTLPQRVRDWAMRTPNAVAMREKDYGIWQEITWSDLWERVTAAAHGLLALGVEAGDRVSIQSEDRP
jgi:long-chain acyl-CoA synthetase